MNYSDTWFGKHRMPIKGSFACEGRTYWMHRFVTLYGDLVPMHNKNDDGSIDVLGVEIITLTPGFTFGSRNLSELQRSLSDYADEIKRDGASIVKRTKNTLLASYKGEKLHIEISRKRHISLS